MTHAVSSRIGSLCMLTLVLSSLVAGCASDGESVDLATQDEAFRRRHHSWCTRKTCADLNMTCGTASDGCGGTVSCGTCPSPTPTPTTPPAPTSTTPPAPTSTTPPPPPAPSGYTLGQRPFAASSSWNTPLPATASYSTMNWPASTGYNYWVNWDGYSPAVYMSSPSDPLVNVTIPDNWGWPAQTLQIRLPAGVSGAVGTDGEILMIDGTTIHNCWQFNRTSDTTGQCAAYGRADALTDSGWGSMSPFLSAGIVATGSSQMAGLLVEAETNAGEIEHALAIVLDGAIQKPGFVGEAISGDGYSSNGIAQEGERFALPPNMTMPSGLSPLGQKVFRAMQKYGVFDIDVAGGCTTIRAQANAYSGPVIEALIHDMNVLMPKLQRVQY